MLSELGVIALSLLFSYGNFGNVTNEQYLNDYNKYIEYSANVVLPNTFMAYQNFGDNDDVLTYIGYFEVNLDFNGTLYYNTDNGKSLFHNDYIDFSVSYQIKRVSDGVNFFYKDVNAIRYLTDFDFDLFNLLTFEYNTESYNDYNGTVEYSLIMTNQFSGDRVVTPLFQYEYFQVIPLSEQTILPLIETFYIEGDSFFNRTQFVDRVNTIFNVNTYDLGFDNGKAEGYAEGYNGGYNTGYSVGYNEGVDADSVVTSIFTGILTIGLVPINFFLSIFNFEILGINIASFVSALLSVAIVIIIARTIFGGKGGEGGE